MEGARGESGKDLDDGIRAGVPSVDRRARSSSNNSWIATHARLCARTGVWMDAGSGKALTEMPQKQQHKQEPEGSCCGKCYAGPDSCLEQPGKLRNTELEIVQPQLTCPTRLHFSYCRILEPQIATAVWIA